MTGPHSSSTRCSRAANTIAPDENSSNEALPLPSDRLWMVGEAAAFFGMGTGWVREHVPAVILPGRGDRRAVRYRPETCRALAQKFETTSIDSSESAA